MNEKSVNITLQDWHKTFTQKLTLHAEETDEVMFDGHWQSVAETEQHYRQLKRSSLLKVAEMFVIIFLMLCVSLAPIIILRLLGAIVS
ncbi:MAG: hypothetical protein KDI83_18435 [Gammaproteobacteria bacterium]|nr:hypothetical protein [Gammaproteobacteria bacterium]